MMKLLAILALILIPASGQFDEATTKIDGILSNNLGMAAFRPMVVMSNEQMHVTLSPTLMGDYPTLTNVAAIVELYSSVVNATGYAAGLEVVVNNMDGIGAYRWYVAPVDVDAFDVVGDMQNLNPGQEGIAGSGAWLYTDPNYVARSPVGDWRQS